MHKDTNIEIVRFMGHKILQGKHTRIGVLPFSPNRKKSQKEINLHLINSSNLLRYYQKAIDSPLVVIC